MSEVDAAQAALAGEHAAVYAYGLVAAALPAAQRSRALDAMAAHRAARDALRARLVALGAEPVAAVAAYDPPTPVTGPTPARALAGLVEDRLAGQYAALAAASTGTDRTTAARAAVACAVATVRWTGTAPTWPGAV